MLEPLIIQNTLTRQIHSNAHSLGVKRLHGDASNRIYHRLKYTLRGRPRSMILMELASPEGFKKSEEKITRSTITIKELPFINILNHLYRAGVSVPQLYYFDRSFFIEMMSGLKDSV